MTSLSYRFKQPSSTNYRSSVPFETSLSVATLLLLIWLPLPVGTDRDWSTGLFVVVTGLLAGLRCLTRLASKRTGSSAALRSAMPLFLLLLLSQLWVIIQLGTGISKDPGASVQYLALGCAYAALFMLIVDLFQTRKQLTLLIVTLICSGTFQAFYGTIMTLSGIEWLLTGPKEAYLGNATGTYVNRNHLAGYLELTLACGIGLLLALRDGQPFNWRHLMELMMGPKARLRLALVVMVIALVMTHSRMGNTAFFASLLIVGGVFTLINPEHRKRNLMLLASLILIDVLVISQFFGLEELKDRLVSTQFENQVSDGEVIARANEQRDDIFNYALPMLAENPLTGVGAGAFETTFQRYPGADIKLHFDHAHNDYLQFAIEYGLVGMLPLALFVLGALAQAFKALWRRESWYRSGVGFSASMGILALMIHSATDFNLQIPANAATFVVVCAIAVLANHHKVPRRKASGSS